VTYFHFRKGELATDLPAANVYAASVAWVRPIATSLFAVLADIIAIWASARHQLPAIFGGSREARSNSTPKPRDWFHVKSKKIRWLDLKRDMPNGDDVS
jgi:hypothetical protein